MGPVKGSKLVLDGVGFPVIGREKIPWGVVRVPLMLYQNARQIKAELLAGSIGTQRQWMKMMKLRRNLLSGSEMVSDSQD